MPTQIPRNGYALHDRINRASSMPGTAARPACTVGKGANARQNHPIRRAHSTGVVGDGNMRPLTFRSRTTLERLAGRAQIARAIVDDGNRFGHEMMTYRGMPGKAGG
jgi:hypothetical protein